VKSSVEQPSLIIYLEEAYQSNID